MNELMNAEEAAKFLKLQPETVTRWAREGLLPAAKLGKEWRFVRQHLLEHVTKLALDNVKRR